jgi:tetratricopeptide (TPR) repeat protein
MSKAKLMALVLSVFACALSLRLVLVREIILQSSLLYKDLNTAPKAGFLTTDSDLYIRLAKDFYSGYFGQHADAGALLRTPGYPAFCAPFYGLGLAPAGILVTQAVLGALIPVVALLLALMLTGSVFLAGLAGFLSVISPSGIGLCGLIMSDMLLAAMFAVGIYLLYCGAIKTNAIWIVSAGLIFAGALMVKPILVLWPAFMIPVFLLFCHAEKKPANWKALVIAIAIQVVILGVWCTRNYVFEKVFSPSSASTVLLYSSIRPRVEEWVKAGGLPGDKAVRRNRDQLNEMIEKQMAGVSTKDKFDQLERKSMEVIRAHPLVTLKVVLQDIKENALLGWDYFGKQLPLGPSLRNRLLIASRQESALREKALIMIAVFFCSLLIATGVKPTPDKRRMLLLASALMLTFGYFAALSGTSYWGGPRYLYPVEFIMILLFILGLQAAGSLSGHAFKQAGLCPGKDSRIAGRIGQDIPWLMALLVLCASLYGTLMIVQKDPDTYSNFGRAVASRGNIEESIPYFQKALQLKPDHFQAKSNLAIAYFELEKYEETVPLLRHIVHIKPGDANNHYLLGVALIRLGNYQEGIKYVEEAIRIDPNHEHAREFLNMQTSETKDGRS